MAEDDQERTERATDKKREEARKKGQVARSQEVLSALVLFGGMMTLYFMGAYIVHQMASYMKPALVQSTSLHLNQANVYGLLIKHLSNLLYMLIPLWLVVIMLGVAGNIMQVGVSFSSEVLSPKFERLDPIKGLKNIFSVRTLMEAAKSLLKVGFLAYASWWLIKKQIAEFPALTHLSVWDILVYTGKFSFRLFLVLGVVMVAIAVIDYAIQKYNFEKSIRMTKKEIRDEMKESEGDPQVKARIRSLQREMAKKRMMQEVPKADVVITNPTHFAIAIKYDPLSMAAPQVVAKGTELIAQKIKEIAKEHKVPVVENKPLAQTLYKTVEIGQFIPPNLFQAVAEVLAYVYKLKKKIPGNLGRQRVIPSPRPATY
ncbi:MAG: flagellar biosynthesis protein FlhB [Nitrospirota bacterium]|nr:flagellar biosynthesis protein FlhB [Nitrospirota bacterium]